MRGWRQDILTHLDEPDPRNLLGDLGRGQHAAVRGLRALRDLNFDHLHLIELRALLECIRIEGPVGVAATEVPGANLPDDVAAFL